MAGWGGAVGLIFSQPEAVGGGAGRLLVYKLGGTKTLPAREIERVFPEPPKRKGSDESIRSGQALFQIHCTRCHGVNAMGTGVVADLRYMPKGSHAIFDQIVYKGIFSSLGMVGFGDVLNLEQVEDIHNFVIDAANDKWEDELSSDWWINTREWIYDKIGILAAWVI
jgi:quinohemoprotein ethanol dehydrogenase